MKQSLYSIKKACPSFLWIGGYLPGVPGNHTALQGKSLDKGKVNSEESRAKKEKEWALIMFSELDTIVPEIYLHIPT